MDRLITKNTFLNAVTCPRLGWLAHHDQLLEDDSPDAELRKQEGIEITCRARGLFPEGKLIQGHMQHALLETGKAIKTASILFEPAFTADGFGARADILIKDKDAWHLIEVKSGLDVDQEYIDDVAYTAMVLARAGLKLKTMSLMVVSRDYRKGMNDKKLLVTEDVTKAVRERVEIFNALADNLRDVLNDNEKPKPQLIFSCRKCEVFEECTGKGIKNHIFELRGSGKRFI